MRHTVAASFPFPVDDITAAATGIETHVAWTHLNTCFPYTGVYFLDNYRSEQSRDAGADLWSTLPQIRLIKPRLGESDESLRTYPIHKA